MDDLGEEDRAIADQPWEEYLAAPDGVAEDTGIQLEATRVQDFEAGTSFCVGFWAGVRPRSPGDAGEEVVSPTGGGVKEGEHEVVRPSSRSRSRDSRSWAAKSEEEDEDEGVPLWG